MLEGFEYDKKQINTLLLGSVILISALFLGLLFFYFIRPIVVALGITIILTYILYPVIKLVRILTRRRHHGIAIFFIFVMIPIYLLTVSIISAIFIRLAKLAQLPEVMELNIISGKGVQEILLPYGVISAETLETFRALMALLGAAGGLFFQIFLATLITTLLLYHEEDIGNAFRSIKSQKPREFVLFVNNGLKHVIYSMFATAFVTGVIAIVVYIIFDVPFPILLGTLTGIVALIPILGAWLVYLPAALYFVGQGETLYALEFLLVSAVFISTLPDIVVRPMLASKSKDVGVGLLLLGFLMGTLAFGPIGIIFGPLIMIALEGAWKILLSKETEKSSKKATSEG